MILSTDSKEGLVINFSHTKTMKETSTLERLRMSDISLKEACYSEVLRALSSIPQEGMKNPLNSLCEKLHWWMTVDKKMVLFGLCTVSSFSFLEGGNCLFHSLLDRGYIISGSWGLFL